MSEAMIVRKGGGGSGRLQEKTVSPSATLQEVTPSEGYDGLSKVNVEAISPTKGAETFTPGLAAQTIPAGRWLTGDQTIAAISPTKGAETFTPGLTAQTIQAGRWLTGDQTIAAISPTKGAETYTPGVTAQTIQAGRWLTGDQTIVGDANLLAANIKKGISIFGVSGSYEAVLDTNNAILKVVTSTGCSVNVSNVADGGNYNITQLDSEGFVRSGDANVTEHFFIIPLAEFGDFTVKSIHPTYGDNEKPNPVTIGYAGRMYEVLCGGKNIILNSTFGPQEGLDFTMRYGTKRYDADYKCYFFTHTSDGYLGFVTESYDLGLYDNIVLKGVFTGYGGMSNHYFDIDLVDKDGVTRGGILYRPYVSGNNMEVSIPVVDKAKSPYTLECYGYAYGSASFRLNEFYFE